jgi:centromeric protein E
MQYSGHIPYRDSKLTRILQPALGGNTKTAIICTITPAACFSEESLSTIKFASRYGNKTGGVGVGIGVGMQWFLQPCLPINRAKKIQNKPKVNEVMDDQALLRRQMKELEEAKQRMIEDKAEIEKYAHTLVRTIGQALTNTHFGATTD